ncbi:MAG: nucleotide sugar dehydrogenase [Pseudomonadota bacterium]
MRLSVIGLGKLGAPLAAVMASKGFDVVGLDLNPHYVSSINEGRAPVQEPQLQELMDASNGRLRATLEYRDAIVNSDLTMVIVPTPSDRNGIFSNDFVLASMDEIGRALREKDDYHVVVITSTVMPGSTDGIIRQRLESASGRKVGQNLGLCYNPEFIALGSVVRDMLYPDMILLGESDPRAGDMLESVYRKSTNNTPPVQRMNLINAEVVKISVNTYVTTKISYANMLAEICERLPGADVNVVTEALGKDTRIGGKYLKGATGYGGPCFPRDNIAFGVLARSVGVTGDIAEATDRVNKRQAERIASLVRANAGEAEMIAILGLSYKPGTPVIEESQAIMLARTLLNQGARVVLWDAMALDPAMAVLPTAIRAKSAADAVSMADAVVVMTGEAEYASIPPEALARPESKPLTIVDCWRVLPAASLPAHATVVYPGVGVASASEEKRAAAAA